MTAIEFKSQVGPSFGNNLNNRVTAYREGRFGASPRPFLGYLFLLEDAPAVHRPVGNAEPYFGVDPAFRGASYARRYELFLRRLLLERLYDAACLTLATNEADTRISHPAEDLGFAQFAAGLRGQASRFLALRRGDSAT